jgi:hypothetical protein
MKKNLLSVLTVGFLASACSTLAPDAGKPTSKDPARLSYTRLYCTPDGETRFETVTIELGKLDGVPPAPNAFARSGAATGVAFAGYGPHWGAKELQSGKLYTPPASQWVVYLEGSMSVATSSNETRRFRAGDVLRVEDPSPCKGHISVVGDESAFIMIVR